MTAILLASCVTGAAIGQTGAPDGLRLWSWRKLPTDITLPHVDDATIIPLMLRIAGTTCADDGVHCCEGPSSSRPNRRPAR